MNGAAVNVKLVPVYVLESIIFYLSISQIFLECPPHPNSYSGTSSVVQCGSDPVVSVDGLRIGILG